MRLARCAAATAGLITIVLVSAPAALAGTGPSPVSIYPNPSAPGTSTTFTIDCSSGVAPGPCTSATLDGSSIGLPSSIPMQPSSQPDVFVATVVLPTSLAPGTYDPEITCSNGISGSATLTVNALPGPAPETGDGTTSTATNTALTNVGLGLFAAGALAGCLVIRRRWSGRASG